MIIGPSNGDWFTFFLYSVMLIGFFLFPKKSTLYFFFGASLCLNATALIKLGYFIRAPVVISFVIIIICIFDGHYRTIKKNNIFVLLLIFISIISCYLYYFHFPELSFSTNFKDTRHGVHRVLLQTIQFCFLAIIAITINNIMSFSSNTIVYIQRVVFFKGIIFGFICDAFYAFWEGLFVWFKTPFINLTNDLPRYWDMGSMFGSLLYWHRVRGFDLEPLNLINYTVFSLGIASLIQMTYKLR
ncbi:MAG: hypothetical protein HQK87_09430, partial [Nitrospinae bacterium]|nr:hypothetical protein [Nitrospinota bacterium]